MRRLCEEAPAIASHTERAAASRCASSRPSHARADCRCQCHCGAGLERLDTDTDIAVHSGVPCPLASVARSCGPCSGACTRVADPCCCCVSFFLLAGCRGGDCAGRFRARFTQRSRACTSLSNHNRQAQERAWWVERRTSDEGNNERATEAETEWLPSPQRCCLQSRHESLIVRLQLGILRPLTDIMDAVDDAVALESLSRGSEGGEVAEREER